MIIPNATSVRLMSDMPYYERAVVNCDPGHDMVLTDYSLPKLIALVKRGQGYGSAPMDTVVDIVKFLEYCSTFHPIDLWADIVFTNNPGFSIPSDYNYTCAATENMEGAMRILAAYIVATRGEIDPYIFKEFLIALEDMKDTRLYYCNMREFSITGTGMFIASAIRQLDTCLEDYKKDQYFQICGNLIEIDSQQAGIINPLTHPHGSYYEPYDSFLPLLCGIIDTESTHLLNYLLNSCTDSAIIARGSYDKWCNNVKDLLSFEGDIMYSGTEVMDVDATRFTDMIDALTQSSIIFHRHVLSFANIYKTDIAKYDSIQELNIQTLGSPDFSTIESAYELSQVSPEFEKVLQEWPYNQILHCIQDDPLAAAKLNSACTTGVWKETLNGCNVSDLPMLNKITKFNEPFESLSKLQDFVKQEKELYA